MPWRKWWFNTAYDEVMAEKYDSLDDLEHDSRALSKEELRHLRRIMKADERARWFWATARTFALWLTAVSIAVISVKNSIIDLFLNAGKH